MKPTQRAHTDFRNSRHGNGAFFNIGKGTKNFRVGVWSKLGQTCVRGWSILGQIVLKCKIFLSGIGVETRYESLTLVMHFCILRWHFLEFPISMCNYILIPFVW